MQLKHSFRKKNIKKIEKEKVGKTNKVKMRIVENKRLWKRLKLSLITK